MIETLKTCIRSGDVGPLRDCYDDFSRLEAFLPSHIRVRVGASEILDELAEWWPEEGRLTEWSAASYDAGYEVVFERHPVDEERPWASRQWQQLDVVDGCVRRHLVWSDRPRHPGQLEPLPNSMAVLTQGAVRTPLSESGASGSRLERIVTADGSSFVLKHISPGGDLLLRLTHDHGREATLHTSGMLERVGDVIDYPVVAVAAENDGFAILLRDVSDSLLVRGNDDLSHSRATARERRDILGCVGRLHKAFRGDSIDGACSITDRLRFLGPVVMTEASGEPEALPRWVRCSWDAFFDIAPGDVAEAVAAIHADPSALAEELSSAETTLIHGDLWAPNIGLERDRVVLLDWALACQAPAELEYAFWILWNTTSLNASPQTLMDEALEVAHDRIDERTLMLALLGEFVSGAGARGWAWNSLNDLDPETRASEREELDWWIGRVREVLDRVWAPR